MSRDVFGPFLARGQDLVTEHKRPVIVLVGNHASTPDLLVLNQCFIYESGYKHMIVIVHYEYLLGAVRQHGD